MSSSQATANAIYKNISKDKETKGFDLCAGTSWIYPLNYPIRDYQYNIVKNALFENTLVSLPTGLGKTFIAAVIMYNYFRWYPNGKIIFMAPTKPLVRQQIDACYNIVGIPKETTVELTGTIQQTTRATMWREKRVFFITPQVLQNDLDSVPEIADNIKCLVLDEAHKAKGTYSYCEVMRKLQERNKYFRVLALSATPGSTVREILEVAKTLYISHLEVKTDESVDVIPYVYKRSITTINVPFDKKLYDVREEYLKIIEVYARVLIQNKVFTGNYSQLTKGRIFMTLKDYQVRKAKNVNIPNYNNIMKSLNICLTLYHGLELLTRHGLRGFLLYYEEHIQKPLLRGNQALHDIINDLNEYLGPLPDWHPMPDGTIPKLMKNIRFGHPKFRKLGDVLSAHFIESGDDATRVIVFFEYKDSVVEAYALLLEYHPLVRAKVFMGQSSITQKQQKSTLNIFRTGECNTLLSTSIGEEGLDVGEVDLIVCFDVSSKSPIRMVQRMGRTGRKREGKIVVLITEGKEEELLRECLVQKKTLNESILNCSELHTHLYQDNPKMVPDNIDLQCHKIHITIRKVEEKPGPIKAPIVSKKNSKTNAKSNAIKAMFESICSSSLGTSNEAAYHETDDRLPQSALLCLNDPNDSCSTRLKNGQIDFSKYIEKQRSWHSTFLVDHSQNSDLLRSMLQFADSKRFNIPQTQIDRTKNTKTGEGLYQSDIRSMFLKQKQTPMSQLEIDVNLNEKVAEILIESKQDECSNNIQTEIRDYLTIGYSNMFNCEMCNKNKELCNLFKCTVKEGQNFNALSWTRPDDSIFEYLNKDTLNKFLRQSKCDSDKEFTINYEEDEFISASIFDDIKFESAEQSDKDHQNLECRRKFAKQNIAVINKNLLEDDFVAIDFLDELLLADINNRGIDKTKSNIISARENSSQSSCIADTMKQEPLPSNNELEESSIPLMNDEFISPGILDYINSNFEKKENKCSNIFKEFKNPTEKAGNSYKKDSNDSFRKSFKFRDVSKNRLNDSEIENTLVLDDEFISSDILIQLNCHSPKEKQDKSLDIMEKNTTSPKRKPVNSPTNELLKKSLKFTTESKDSVHYREIENTLFFDDEFISSDILIQLNASTSQKVKNNKSLKVMEQFKSPRQKIINTQIQESPKKSFKFKSQSAINKSTDNLNYGDFFGEDILNELSSINFNYKSSADGQNRNPDKSFKLVSDIDKSVVLADIIPRRNSVLSITEETQNECLDKSANLHKSVDVKNFTNTLPESEKTFKNSISEDDADSNETILISPNSECDEANLNRAFLDQQSRSPKLLQQFNMQTLRNDCMSPDLFSDSGPCTPDEDILDNYHDGTILFSPKSFRQHSHKDDKHFLYTSRSSSNEGSPVLSRKLKISQQVAGLPKKSQCILLSSDNVSTENSPSLWNLSKMYTQTSKGMNGTSQNFECIESLSFSESIFNNVNPVEDVPFQAPKRIKKLAKVKRKLALNSSFLNMEAQVDGSQSADEDEADLNEYDTSFVNDASQSLGNTTTLHAFYLKSTRSPQKKHVGFKIPPLPKMDKMNIFSQIEPTQQDTYLEDSFCVDVLTQNISKERDLDVLEEAEKILKNMKRRKKSLQDESNQKKRRRILVLSDSD